MIPYLKQGAQATSRHAQLISSTTAAGKLSVVIRVRNRFKTSWQKHIAVILRKQNVIWCFLSQILARARQRIWPSRARFAAQRAVSARSLEFDKVIHCQGIVKYGSKITGLPLNSELKSP